ncbi:MAG: DMT family transporter [Candidatus Symbiothrix sp.]|jgi:drug/metabolite transporter (DMT)-like permease|nr:DMT family transporter [Candidatus Symbiothrix sp.]
MKNNKGIYGIALFCVIIWGTTFVSTKVLINNGLTPSEIFFVRFALGYTGLLCIAPPKFSKKVNWKDEFLFFITGLTGGSLYFLAENTALELTQTSNVSVLVATTPIWTALVMRLTDKVKIKKNLIIGSCLGLAGVALVAFNGNAVLKISPVGDCLSLLAAFLWALYGIVLKKLDNRYSTFIITRKVFFYGLLTILPVFLLELGRPQGSPIQMLSFNFEVIFNLLFLGIAASLLCYLLWNKVIEKLGAQKSTSFIYIVTLTSLVTAAIVLHETITPIAMLGALFILLGVYLSEKNW